LMNFIRTYFSFLSLALLLQGCALGIGTVKYSLDDSKFKSENLPVRELKVIAIIDRNGHSKRDIAEHIEEVSHLMTEQVGISLKIFDWVPISYERVNPEKRAYQIMEELSLSGYKSYDIAIGFGSSPLPGKIVLNIIGGVPGAIEDDYRRHIALNGLELQVTIHEIFHCFIFSHNHSNFGIMQPIQIKLLPLTPSFNICNYLSREDREEVLRNKWRDFSKKPMVQKREL